MLNLTLTTTNIKAAIFCAANKDSRYYLNGVHIRIEADNCVYVESINGSAAFQTVEKKLADTDQKGPFSIIIPLAAAKTAAKTKSPRLTLAALPDGRYSLGDVIFAALDGIFPNVDRIIPPKEPFIGPVPVFDAALLNKVQSAMRTANNSKGVFYSMWALSLDGGRGYNSTFLVAAKNETYPRCVICGIRESALS